MFLVLFVFSFIENSRKIKNFSDYFSYKNENFNSVCFYNFF